VTHELTTPNGKWHHLSSCPAVSTRPYAIEARCLALGTSGAWPAERRGLEGRPILSLRLGSNPVCWTPGSAAPPSSLTTPRTLQEVTLQLQLQLLIAAFNILYTRFFTPVCSILLRMYYKYIYDTSLYLLSQHCVYFDTSHSLSSHVSALRAIIR
jgi:hypothetical protein